MKKHNKMETYYSGLEELLNTEVMTNYNLFIVNLAMKIFGYNKDGGIGSISSLKFYGKWLFPISKFLDTIGLKYLFGKNVVLIATKK